MFYLSEGTEFFSSDKFEGAQVMQRLFFEQYSHEPFIATSRFWYLTGKAQEYHRKHLNKNKHRVMVLWG
jgi:glutathione S-transferase